MRYRSLAAISMLLAVAACAESPTGPSRGGPSVPIPNALGPTPSVPPGGPRTEDMMGPPKP